MAEAAVEWYLAVRTEGLPMRRLRGTVMAVAAACGALGVYGLTMVGCGDDTSGQTSDSGSDTTSDTNPDVPVGPDVQNETGGGDAADAGDTGVITTEGGDAPVVETGADVEAGPPPGAVFAQQEATAYCNAFLNCCGPGLDAGTYNVQACIGNLITYGWEGNLPSDQGTYYRGHVSVDQTKAANCLAALQSAPCGTDMMTAAQWSAITQACELVITGTIPVNGAGCSNSFECATNSYCDPTVDGGLCRPLQAQGQPCNTIVTETENVGGQTIWVNPIPDYMCSYLGSGSPALFCDLINNAPDAATCQPLLANGANCVRSDFLYYDDQACPTASALCGDNNTCGSTATYPLTGFCQTYQITDAGGGG